MSSNDIPRKQELYLSSQIALILHIRSLDLKGSAHMSKPSGALLKKDRALEHKPQHIEYTP